MGSCSDLAVIEDGPLGRSCIEQHSCFELMVHSASEQTEVCLGVAGTLCNSKVDINDDEPKDDTIISGSFAEGVVDDTEENSDVCGEMGTDTLVQVFPLVGCQIPSKLNLNGLLSNCSELDNQSLCTRDIQEFCSQSCKSILENSHMAYSLGDCTQQDEQINGPAAEIVTEVLEEKSDEKFDCCTRIVPIEDNACNVKENSIAVVSGSTNEDSASLQPCQPQPSGIVDNGSSTRLDVLDLSGSTAIKPINSSGVAHCSGQANYEEKVTIRVDSSSEINHLNILSSYSQRPGQTSKISRKNKTKRNAKKCRTRVKAIYPDGDGSTKVISEAARRKRSCIFKPARSSIWGLLGNIAQHFDQSNWLGVDQVQNKGSEQAKDRQENGKQKNNQAGGGLPGSREKCRTSSSCIRLKVLFGKQVIQSDLKMMTSEVVDAKALATAVTSGCGIESGACLELSELNNSIEDNLIDEGKKNLAKTKTFPDASSKNLESTVILEKSAGDAAGNYLETPFQVVDESSDYEKRCIEAGTSPDSEVINLVTDAQVIVRHQEDLHDATASTFKDRAAPRDFMYKRRKKKEKLSRGRKCMQENKSTGPAGTNKAKSSKKRGGRQKMGDISYSTATLTSSTIAIASSISSSNKATSSGILSLSGETEIGVLREGSTVERGTEAKADSGLHIGPGLSESYNRTDLLPSTKPMGNKLSKLLKSGGGSKGSSKVNESGKSRRGNTCSQRGNPQKLVDKSKFKGKGALEKVVCKVENHIETGNHIVTDIEETKTVDNIASTDVSNLGMVPAEVVLQKLPPAQAWVCCDDCQKWRRIPAILAASIGANQRWICKDNTDENFSDCSFPQEMSNAEINAELELSDVSCDEDTSDSRLNIKQLDYVHSKGRQPASFTYIPANEFLHRNRKKQTIDEIMVCNCKPARDGRSGCGDECLNRMLNIECVKGTCPCGEICSNQQFQKRDYAKLKWFRSGKKGYGLQSLGYISKGQFLIEYVGEVLDLHAYEARQKTYASEGHKHFYFMTLNGSEVIDACAKGNMGRFINHSCDPNCRTEKWMVNGEICIGLFALKNIKKGEELTFDYNYVRVFGAAAKKCYCGSPQCRGFIGGDPLNSEEIVHGDSDEEFPEPVMLSEGGEIGDALDNLISSTSPSDVAEMKTSERVVKDRTKVDKFVSAVERLEITAEIDDSNISDSANFPSHRPLEMLNSAVNLTSSVEPAEVSLRTDDIMSKPMSSVQQNMSMEGDTINKPLCSIPRLETSSPSTKPEKLLLDGALANRKSQSDTVENKQVSLKSHPRVKTSRSSSFAKKGKVSVPQNGNKSSTTNRSQVLSIKTKRLMEGSTDVRFEGVEEKLNELLDVDGGISKGKDAPKGYLKLLLLTAASGDGFNGEAIQSNRDLSMILDALLKTKSRVVLTDIINKNGLQMLHKMMKQYRRDFKKIPILRKLLKVLEHLAVRKILVPEHINGGPPCPGMESFRESILSLTEHDDKQVHQIARNFRDRWIPRHFRRPSYMDRDDGWMESSRVSNYNRLSASHNPWPDQGGRLTEAIDCVQQSVVTSPPDTGASVGSSAPCTGSPTNGIKKRKRKSRWDQPADSNNESTSLQHIEQKTMSVRFESSPLPRRGEMALEDCCDHNHHQQEVFKSDDERQNLIYEDAPPGFSCRINHPMLPSNTSSTDLPPEDVVTGHPRERFISRLPVSYGIPMSIVNQFGTHQAENLNDWLIAPGVPFHPFPPLPPHPHNKSDSSNMSGANEPYVGNPGPNNQHMRKRMRDSSYDLGRRYFRQQKLNNSKGPPWLRNRNGWEFTGSNSRNGMCNIGVRNIENEVNNMYSPQDVGSRVEKEGNHFCQHQNQH